MPVPVVTNVYPAFGHASGQSVVRVLGAGFSVQTSGAVPSLSLRFGPNASPKVLVINESLAYAIVPAGPGPGDVAVTAQNLDPQTGIMIAGESSSVVGLFRYRDVELTEPSVLTRVVEAFILALRAQVMRNVTMAHVHADYDAATGDAYNLTELQQLPALVVTGPEVTPVSNPQEGAYVSELGQQVYKRSPMLADLGFTLTLVSDKFRQLINLQALLIAFFDRNPYLVIDKDPEHPEQGKVQYAMGLEGGGAPSLTAAGDENNVKTAGARAAIYQVPLQGLAGFTQPGMDGVDITRPVSPDCGVELSVVKL